MSSVFLLLPIVNFHLGIPTASDKRKSFFLLRQVTAQVSGTGLSGKLKTYISQQRACQSTRRRRGLLCFYQTLIMVLKDWMVWRNRVRRDIIVLNVLFGPLLNRIFSMGKVIFNMHGMCSAKIMCMNVFQRLRQLQPKFYSVFRYILRGKEL